MRPKPHTTNDVPADLATYDHERWERWAAEHPNPPVPSHFTAHDGYHAALVAACVDDDEVRQLLADAVVADMKRRLGWRGP